MVATKGRQEFGVFLPVVFLLLGIAGCRSDDRSSSNTSGTSDVRDTSRSHASGTSSGTSSTSHERGPDPELLRIFENKCRQISRENDAFGEHPWAGEYDYSPSKTGPFCQLSLAPEAGVAYQYETDEVGSRSLYAGSLTEKDGKITLQWQHRGPFLGELLVFRWGERHYLVLEKVAPVFLSRIQANANPESSFYTWSFLRRGDRNKQGRGEPELPEDFKVHWQVKPQSVAIIAFGTEKKYDAISTNTVTLGAGMADGILPGMMCQLPDDTEHKVFMEIHTVREHEAEATVHYEGTSPVAVGMKVSTLKATRE